MPIFVAWLLHYQSHVWLISPPRLRNRERVRLVSTAPPPMPALHTAAQPWTINPPKLNLKFDCKIKFWQRFACNGEHWSLSHTNLLKVRKSTKAILWPQFDQRLKTIFEEMRNSSRNASQVNFGYTLPFRTFHCSCCCWYYVYQCEKWRAH